jgi:hypothetical protein
VPGIPFAVESGADLPLAPACQPLLNLLLSEAEGALTRIPEHDEGRKPLFVDESGHRASRQTKKIGNLLNGE